MREPSRELTNKNEIKYSKQFAWKFLVFKFACEQSIKLPLKIALHVTCSLFDLNLSLRSWDKVLKYFCAPSSLKLKKNSTQKNVWAQSYHKMQ